MGSQLAKGDTNNSTSNRTSTAANSSGLLRRANQPNSSVDQQKGSFSPSRHHNTSSTTSSGVSTGPSASPVSKNSSSIIVVNAGRPSASANTASKHPEHRLKRIPIPLRPLIPIGQAQVNPSFPQLSAAPILDLGLELEQELRANAEFVAREQTKLVEKIRDIDSQVSASSVTIGAERQRRFNKAVDNFGKFDEIDALIQRCETDIENILTVFVQLNEALPDNLCLEQFALKV